MKTYSRETMAAIYTGVEDDNDSDVIDGADAFGDDEDVDVSAFGLFQPLGGQVCSASSGGITSSYTTTANEYCAVISATNLSANQAQLVGWIDFDKDGAFQSDERSVPQAAGEFTFVGDNDVTHGNDGGDDGTHVTGNLAIGVSDIEKILVWELSADALTPMANNLSSYARFRITTRCRPI